MSILGPRLDIDHVVCKAQASSRKRVLQTIAETVAATCSETNAIDLFDGLLARERLGSTSIGEGVAIPHCRQAVSDISVCLVTTEDRIDYEASDGEAVDIFFALIVPNAENEAHLRALADLSTALVASRKTAPVCVTAMINRRYLRKCTRYSRASRHEAHRY